jgi:hypothetical protein
MEEDADEKASLLSLFRHLRVSDLQHRYVLACTAGLRVRASLPYVFAVIGKLDVGISIAFVHGIKSLGESDTIHLN